MKGFIEYQKLDEKLILHNQGKRFGQAVFVVGGSASGKDFAISNFMQSEKYKIRDVDAWKVALIKLDSLAKKVEIEHKKKGINTQKLFGVSASELKLDNPKDVFTLHGMVDELGWKSKTINLILQGAKNKETLPNILFNVTFKNKADVYDMIPKLIGVGYLPKNIHMIWVLADYRVSLSRNASRKRVVPSDILLYSHAEAGKNMIDVIRGSIPPNLDGRIDIILNNSENTIFWTDKKGNKILSGKSKSPTIKSFTYFQFKKEGKSPDRSILSDILAAIAKNAPEEVMAHDRDMHKKE